MRARHGSLHPLGRTIPWGIVRTGCVAGLLTLAACVQVRDPPLARDPGQEPVVINRTPTGSIGIPSLCERISTDVRVTLTGAEAFAFVWAIDHYQVVYTGGPTRDLFALQLDAAGQVISPAVLVESNPSVAEIPSLIATSTGYVVAWQEVEGEGRLGRGSVRVHALDPAGQPVGEGQTLASGRSAQMRPVLAPSPDGVAVAWMDQSATDHETHVSVGDSITKLGLLDEDLRLRTDVAVRTVSPAARAGYPWLAGDDKGLALLWTRELGGRTDTYFASINHSLELPAETCVRDAGAANAALLGRLLGTDFGYLAAWEDLRSGEEEIYMALLDPSGRPVKIGLVEEPDTGNANWPHLVWTGTTAAVVYYQFRGGRPQVFLTFLDANGERVGGGSDAQISSTSNWARYPDVVWTGSEFGVLWIDSRHGDTDLYFNRAACRNPAPL